MGKQRLICGICKSKALGFSESPRFIDGATVTDRSLICGDCAPLWNKFRLDLDQADTSAAALARVRLGIRGAVTAELHAKIARQSDGEAAKILALGVDIEAIAKDIDPANITDVAPPEPLPKWPR